MRESVDIFMSKNDKIASNTLNTYLYCCKSLPRTVNQILHLPSSLRSKNSLHGLRWGGFWIATPLPATLNTYTCKSLPRTVNQILHLPLSLKSKNSLHGLRWGGFWIAIPLRPHKLRPGMISHAQLRAAPRMREGGVEMPKRTRKPSLKVRENLQFQEEKECCTYHYPSTIR